MSQQQTTHPEVIRVAGLNKVYRNGTQALFDIDFSAHAGETVILLGANGSGKSTLQKCLNGLVEPTDGTVEVLGTEITAAGKKDLTKLRRQVGMVHQRINLVRELSVLTNVIHGALGRAPSPRNWFGTTATRQQRDEAMEALDRVDLAHVAAQRAEQLSGGQQQRVAIARMLMQRPQIVLADEPVAALDPHAGRAVMDMLWEISEERNLTLICTLHQLELARTYGRRIVALRDGRLEIDADISGLADNQLEGLYSSEPSDQSQSQYISGVA